MIKLIITFKETKEGQVTIEDRLKNSNNVTGGEIKAASVFQQLNREYRLQLLEKQKK